MFQQFANPFDPLEHLGKWALPRLPRFKLEPTARNTTRGVLVTVAGLYGIAIILAIVVNHLEAIASQERERQSQLRSPIPKIKSYE